MTIVVGVLVAVAVVAVAAWWLFDFDAPEFVVPVALPGAGALFIYWYGTPLTWAIGVAAFVVAGAIVVFLFRHTRATKADRTE